jgi:hypothetical protein
LIFKPLWNYKKHAEFGGMVKPHKFSKRWSEITKAGLADRDNYKTPHLDVANQMYEGLRLYAADIFMGTYLSEMIDVSEGSYTG